MISTLLVALAACGAETSRASGVTEACQYAGAAAPAGLATLELQPWMIPVGNIVLLGAGALLFVQFRRRRRRKQAESQLQAFKERVVAYSDAMDRIKERHKMLPFTDPDFTAPMVGETLAAYEEVELALKRHNDHWLELMDTWDKAQSLLEKGGTSESIQVVSLVEGTRVEESIGKLQQECDSELDRLEQAHQRVDALLESNQVLRGAIAESIASVEGRNLSTEPYDEPLGEIAARTEEGERLRTADPLNAELELQQAQQHLQHLRDRVTGVLEQHERAQLVERREHAAVALAARHRAEGLRFGEPRGNPDPMLEEVRERHATALRVLQQGDYEGARRHLDHAEGLLDEATESIQFQVRFRDEGSHVIRDLQSQVRKLLDDVEQAHHVERELERRHANESWRQVEPNAKQADELGQAMVKLLDEAERESDHAIQRYYRAQELIDEVRSQLPDAQHLVEAVETRLQELDELAQQCARWATDLDAEARRIETVLRTNTADRPRSNHRYELAASSLVRALEDTQQGRPNWPQVQRDLEHVDKDLQAVNQMIQEDLRLAQQATAEIREASQELRRCQGFYQMGVSPNTGNADGELRSAERALQRQEYEEAIRLANSAESAARNALEAARREAEEREREAQRRRNAEAAMQMAQVLAAAAAQAAAQMAATRRHRRRF
ncbi:MAG: hypothetical protein KDB14_05210 [Planctomycetales bacterium]|nr:hypothetical protein [Planctomycetales bacterium]